MSSLYTMLCSIEEKTFGSHNTRLFAVTNGLIINQTHFLEYFQKIEGYATDISSVSNNVATLSNCGKPLKLEKSVKQKQIMYIDVKMECQQCHDNKTFDEFPKSKMQNGNYRYKKICKKCHCENEKKRRIDNIEKYREKDKQYYKENKSNIVLKNKEYRNCNKDAINIQKQEYYKDNITQIKEYHQDNKKNRNEKNKIKRKQNPYYALKEALKVRIFDILKSSKKEKTSNLVGCSCEELKIWIESHFDENISWDNYSTYWHLDHVIPIAFFDLTIEDERYICFNWSNVRPLEKKQNISKSDNILEKYILQHYEELKKFNALHERYQAMFEKTWWQRLELWYGKNPQGEDNFKNYLKWAIRSQDPKSFTIVDSMDKVQRLNGSGSVDTSYDASTGLRYSLAPMET